MTWGLFGNTVQARPTPHTTLRGIVHPAPIVITVLSSRTDAGLFVDRAIVSRLSDLRCHYVEFTSGRAIMLRFRAEASRRSHPARCCICGPLPTNHLQCDGQRPQLRDRVVSTSCIWTSWSDLETDWSSAIAARRRDESEAQCEKRP